MKSNNIVLWTIIGITLNNGSECTSRPGAMEINNWGCMVNYTCEYYVNQCVFINTTVSYTDCDNELATTSILEYTECCDPNTQICNYQEVSPNECVRDTFMEEAYQELYSCLYGKENSTGWDYRCYKTEAEVGCEELVPYAGFDCYCKFYSSWYQRLSNQSSVYLQGLVDGNYANWVDTMNEDSLMSNFAACPNNQSCILSNGTVFTGEFDDADVYNYTTCEKCGCLECYTCGYWHERYKCGTYKWGWRSTKWCYHRREHQCCRKTNITVQAGCDVTRPPDADGCDHHDVLGIPALFIIAVVTIYWYSE